MYYTDGALSLNVYLMHPCSLEKDPHLVKLGALKLSEKFLQIIPGHLCTQ